jgi:hypothetical protein
MADCVLYHYTKLRKSTKISSTEYSVYKIRPISTQSYTLLSAHSQLSPHPSPQNFLQRIDPRLHNLLILRRRPRTRPNASNNLSLRVQNRQSSAESSKSTSVRITESISCSTGPHSVFVHMCTDPVTGCCERFVNCYLGAVSEMLKAKLQVGPSKHGCESDCSLLSKGVG